jgi:hypothetical protein
MGRRTKSLGGPWRGGFRFEPESCLDIASSRIENLVTLSYQGSALNFQNCFLKEKYLQERNVSLVCCYNLLVSEQILHENESAPKLFYFDPAGGLDFFELALCSAVTL